ncbi:MAG: DUF4340 domain-containing protein [Flavobacteriales bacterium]|nr:DUF4340 domain-containing protein [Flavobacteriales bacterium]MCB9365304.1 DUF4340 domain-containing protein [Flavobacteriales bacterium]
MKNNKPLLIILVVLLAIAAYFFTTNNSSTLKSRDGVLSDFTIEDTTTIDKIFISNSSGESVTLIKGEGNDWLVDGKHKARPESISLLMTTFAQIQVKSPVSSTELKNVITSIATESVKVEIYQGDDKPSKVYYVGGSTQNHQGTFMLLEKDGVKSSEPFVTHIPGFYGYLTTRFYSNATTWRDAAIFKYAAGEIKEIEIDYFDRPEESFLIEQNGTSISLYGKQEAKLINNFDSTKVKAYLTFFDRVYYENVLLNVTEAQKDSIINTQPYFSIKVTDIFGKQNKIVSYRLPFSGDKNMLDGDGNPYKYDLDRMCGYFNDDVLVLIQYRIFDKFILPKNFFLKE